MDLKSEISLAHELELANQRIKQQSSVINKLESDNAKLRAQVEELKKGVWPKSKESERLINALKTQVQTLERKCAGLPKPKKEEPVTRNKFLRGWYPESFGT